ncbi:TetR family transcriptional regulator [Ktedonobacteria bacterium brp13]|nr:TetR family transcriptional regulator [Ktedonobacteria bacterium brp13]
MTDIEHPQKRTYHSPARERQAEESRQRILQAARVHFLERGYSGTTIDAIAKEAGVSPKTVTAIFGTKQGIMAEMLQPSAFGERYQQLLRQIRNASDPIQGVQIIAQICRQIYELLTPELDLLRGATMVSPELMEISQQINARRKHFQGAGVMHLAQQGLLRQELTVTEAIDEFWTLTAYDLYHMLVQECGWSPDQYEAWLIGLLRQRLLKPQSEQASEQPDT